MARMKIEVTVIKEHEDGSADADIFMDEEAKDFLLKKAIIDTLKEAVAFSANNYAPKTEE